MGDCLVQGGWENDESVHEAACREAFEEAGVKGNLNVRLNRNMLVGCLMKLQNLLLNKPSC